MLLESLVMSRINYYCSLYYGLPATSTKYLDRIIRFCFNTVVQTYFLNFNTVFFLNNVLINNTFYILKLFNILFIYCL